MVPYLEGERTPNRPRATGSVHGLTLRTSTPAHLARAAVEGMLCALADGLDALTAQGAAVRRVILVGGGVLAFLAFIVWIVRLVDAADTADATGDYVDIYDLQDFMVRVALGVNIGFTVATVLLIAAGVAASLLLLRISRWQHDQVAVPPVAVAPPPPPQYAPRYTNPGPTFPSYRPPS